MDYPRAVGGRVIRTPDQRVRVFVSSTLAELRAERNEVRAAVESLRLVPVMFELGARPHPPRELYRAYLRQSDVFIGVYGSSYGWVAPGEEVSGLEDEYRLAGTRPRLLYLKTPAPDREPRLQALLAEFSADDQASYKRFTTVDELGSLVRDDLAVLLSETFEAARRPAGDEEPTRVGAPVPAPPTATVGRGPLLDRVADHLRSSRMVTLTGVGGIGKTRVATEVARARQRAGTEVVFVPLAEATDAGQALRVLQTATGGRAEGADTTLDSVVARLVGRPVLLCLDNLEQVTGMEEVVSELLERLPDITVLATSRRALRVLAEQEVRVEPLDVPAVGEAQISRTPAVQLFVARAHAVAESFALTQANASDIAEITRRLDGVPLAIELAAARTRVLSPHALLQRLDDRFSLLVGGGPDLPHRQQTLRTTLDWSHDLLSPDEKAVFARLSVFADSWTLEAAEAVCGEDVDVVEALAGLLDKSLVEPRDEPDSGEPRFAMLQTVHSYATEQLRARGETPALRDRHLTYFRALGRRAMPSLCGPGQREWLARLDPDLSNVREAADHALGAGRPREVVDLVWDILVHYLVRDALDEPDEWLSRARAWRDELDEVTRARLDASHAGIRLLRGDDTDVLRELEEPLQVFRREGLDFEAAVTLHHLGFVRFSQEHDLPGALAALRESATLFQKLGHDWGVSLAEAKQGSVLATMTLFDEARAHLAAALLHARRIESEAQEVQALVQLALVQVVDDDRAAALETLRSCSPFLRRGRYLADTAMSLDAAAAVALDAERHELAVVAAAAAAATRARVGVMPWPTWSRFVDSVHTCAGGVDDSLDDSTRKPIDVLDVVLDELLGRDPAAGELQTGEPPPPGPGDTPRLSSDSSTASGRDE
jgi:predicted ATPase